MQVTRSIIVIFPLQPKKKNHDLVKITLKSLTWTKNDVIIRFNPPYSIKKKSSRKIQK